MKYNKTQSCADRHASLQDWVILSCTDSMPLLTHFDFK